MPTPTRTQLQSYTADYVALQGAKKALAEAKAAGQPTASITADIDRLERVIRLADDYFNTGSTMSTTKFDTFKKNLHDLDLFVADAADGHLPADYARRRTDELLAAARDAHDEALREAIAVRKAKLDEARDLRAAAEATRDPQVRIADELERTRLLLEKADGKDLATKAQAMLVAGQAERAKFYLDVAQSLGVPAHKLSREVEAALDGVIPERVKARALETEAISSHEAFMTARLDALIASGVGITENGEFGNGKPEHVANAQVLSNAAKFRAQQAAKAADGAAA